MSSFIEFGAFRLAFPEEFATLGTERQAELERWRESIDPTTPVNVAVLYTHVLAASLSVINSTTFLHGVPNAQRLLSELDKEERVVDEGWEVDWPAFRAAEPDIFDRTNPTITRLAESGFNKENAFWIDQFCRRKQATLKDKKRFLPRKHVEPAVLSHHHEWLYLCLRKSAAKVMVIFGQENEALFKEKWGDRLKEMPLWGDYKGESLWMLSPKNDDSRLERLVLFMWHPEHVGRKENIAMGTTYDKQLGLAASMVGIVRSEEQAHFNETSCTTPESIARAVAAAEATEEDKFAIIKRGFTKRKREKGLTMDDVAVETACTVCQYPRLDVTPFYFAPDETTGPGVLGRYEVAYTQCPRCDKPRNFAPVDTDVAFSTRDTNKRPKKARGKKRKFE
ncbi:hypothetical protein N0V82_007655 [Gnomoniopsis sp. IMI 355080]|nr:hypothetical protein N0V82_007655 [Gnomoniopsis sp. IMI 355080]